MNDKVNLAWAVEVDDARLGARLEAYVETKATITTLRLCLRDAASNSMNALSSEIIQMIADHVKDKVYRDKIRRWQISSRCARDTNLPNYDSYTDLFTNTELEPSYVICDCYCLDSDHREGCLIDDACGRRENILKSYLQTITLSVDSETSKRFARCVEIFSHDLGIRPFYSVLKQYEDSDGYVYLHPDTAEVLSYLALPVTKAPLRSQKGRLKVSYVVRETVDPQLLCGTPSDEIRQQFKKAVHALRLERPRGPHTYVSLRDTSTNDQVYDLLQESRCKLVPTFGMSVNESLRDKRSTTIQRKVQTDNDNNSGCSEGAHECNIDGYTPPVHTINHDGSQCLLKISDDVWILQRPIRDRISRCLDCGTVGGCLPDTEIKEPELMLLASGEVESYDEHPRYY